MPINPPQKLSAFANLVSFITPTYLLLDYPKANPRHFRQNILNTLSLYVTYNSDLIFYMLR